MKKFRELISRPFVTVALFALALVLLGGSTVGGARAALTVESQVYDSKVQTSSIGVELLENGNPVGDGGELLSNLLEEGESLKIGYAYPERLQVRNYGAIDEYVRVTVYKYWLQKDEGAEAAEKAPTMNSEWIKLDFATEAEGWKTDADATTEERTVLYYTSVLPSGETTENPFLKSIAIDKKAARTVTQVESGPEGSTIIKTTYLYNGSEFCIEVHVDGVQAYNGEKARLSAWGTYQ